MFRYSRHMAGTKCSREWLSQLLKRKKLNEKALAEKMGVTARLVRHWKAGSRSPARHAYALAQHLGPDVHKHLAAEQLAQIPKKEVA